MNQDGNPPKGCIGLGEAKGLTLCPRSRHRVVEVGADLGEGSSRRWRYGSGLLIGRRQVLTAAHVVAGATALTVRGPNTPPW